jgi:hypothetical protein
MTLEDRQRQAAYDFKRSSFTPTPTSIAQAKLDLALMKAERDRQQRQRIEAMEQDIRQSCADMADLIEHAKQGEFR